MSLMGEGAGRLESRGLVRWMEAVGLEGRPSRGLQLNEASFHPAARLQCFQLTFSDIVGVNKLDAFFCWLAFRSASCQPVGLTLVSIFLNFCSFDSLYLYICLLVLCTLRSSQLPEVLLEKWLMWVRSSISLLIVKLTGCVFCCLEATEPVLLLWVFTFAL